MNISINYNSVLYTIVCILTAMVGHAIHHNIFWAIMDFIFAPFAWLKWVLLHQVTLTIIKSAFIWFLR